jgi:uncharacterized membrane protein YhaH (DUF805 family)
MDVHAIIDNFRRTVTAQYFDFNGRTARAGFWYYMLVYVLLYIVVSILESILGFGAITQYGNYYYQVRPLTGLLTLALLLPNLGIGVRRLHDTNHSGFWLLIGLIPIVGWLVLIYWYVQPGTVCANRYGDDVTGSCPISPPAG